jgi:hypothetical protein
VGVQSRSADPHRRSPVSWSAGVVVVAVARAARTVWAVTKSVWLTRAGCAGWAEITQSETWVTVDG